MNRNCGKCAFLINGGGCGVFGRPVNPQIDICDKFRFTAEKCDCCQRLIISGGIIIEKDGNYNICCNECYQRGSF